MTTTSQAHKDAKQAYNHAYWLANSKAMAPFQNINLAKGEPHAHVASYYADNRLTSNLGHGGNWVQAKRGAL